MSDARPVPPNYDLDDRLLLRFSDAADRLSVSVSTVKRHVRSGSLATVLVGSARRIAVADLAAFVEALRDGAASNRGPRP